MITKIADVQHLISRGLGNTQEQRSLFMVSFWVHAIFVNYEISAILGWVYIIFRVLYIPAYAWYGQFSTNMEFTTLPQYIAVWYFNIALLP
eukprot:UN10274